MMKIITKNILLDIQKIYFWIYLTNKQESVLLIF